MVITNHKPAQQKIGKKKTDQQNKAGSEASTSKAGVPSKTDSAPDKQSKPSKKNMKKDEAGAIGSETTWSDPKFNDSDLTMKQLQNMIKTLAGEVIEKKYKDLKNDMEEEVEWRVSAQTEEMEETIEKLKGEISALKEENKSTKKD